MNGTSLIQIEALKNRRKRYFSTNTYVSPSQWDKKKCMVINHPNALRLNAYLYELLHKVEAEELLFWKLGKDCTLEMLKQSVKSGGEATENFCRFARRTVEASSRKKGTKDNLYSTIRLLEKFNKSVTFEELTQGFLQSFEQYVAKQNFLPNTITKHLRNIRTLVNEGIRAGYLKQSQYPFVGFKLHKEKTKHRNLTDEEVEKLEQLSLKGRDEKVRDAFLFCCYTGLRYSDFVALRVEHLCSINNATWLVFDSQKTGQKTRVPIEKIFGGKAMAILDKYKLERFVDIGSNSRVNAALHRITEAAGIAQHVSFHMARHTFKELNLLLITRWFTNTYIFDNLCG